MECARPSSDKSAIEDITDDCELMADGVPWRLFLETSKYKPLEDIYSYFQHTAHKRPEDFWLKKNNFEQVIYFSERTVFKDGGEKREQNRKKKERRKEEKKQNHGFAIKNKLSSQQVYSTKLVIRECVWRIACVIQG